MAPAMNMITTRRTRFPARTIFRKRWGGRPFTIRPSAASSAKSASGWIIGPSCARSVDESLSALRWNRLVRRKGSYAAGIQVAELDVDSLFPRLRCAPNGRRWTRLDVMDYIGQLTDKPTLVGIDFCFS